MLSCYKARLCSALTSQETTTETASTSVLNHPVMVTSKYRSLSKPIPRIHPRNGHLINRINSMCSCVCLCVWKQKHLHRNDLHDGDRREERHKGLKKRKEASYRHFSHSSPVRPAKSHQSRTLQGAPLSPRLARGRPARGRAH